MELPPASKSRKWDSSRERSFGNPGQIDYTGANDMLGKLLGMDDEQLKKAYTERDMEPPMADESWRPSNTEGLLE